MNFKKRGIWMALATALTLSATAANATPVIGTFDMASPRANGIVVTPGEIDWFSPANPGLDTTKTYGQFTISGIPTGSFAALPVLNPDGYVQDLSNNPADANYVPLGASVTPNFIKLADKPNWLFTLTFLSPGTDVDGVGPLPQAPYTLTEDAAGVTATFSAFGTICDAGVDGVCDKGDDLTKFSALFTTQFVEDDEDTIAELVGKLTNPNIGFVDTSWSGSVTAEKIPEPSSLALLGLGLAGFAGLRRRKQN